MSSAIQLIVDGYRTVGDWAALESLHAHRLRLKQQMQEQQAGGALDVSATIRTMDDDLKVIEAALAEAPARRFTP